jgi:hypothetical protein
VEDLANQFNLRESVDMIITEYVEANMRGRTVRSAPSSHRIATLTTGRPCSKPPKERKSLTRTRSTS